MPSTVRINPWLRRFHPSPGAPIRLVYFPHAGGAASTCHRLSAALPPVAELVAVQYPGRQDRFGEPLLDSIGAIADEIPQWLEVLRDKPMAFFGHSMGSVIAYEVARRLHADGLTLTHLFVSGRRGPTISRVERAHLQDDKGLIDEMRALQGTDDAVFDDEEVMQLVLPSVRADYRAIETYEYRPGPPLTCPMTAVIGDSDPRVDRADAEAWRLQTTGEFTLHVFPGGHFYLGDGAIAIADLLRDELAARV